MAKVEGATTADLGVCPIANPATGYAVDKSANRLPLKKTAGWTTNDGANLLRRFAFAEVFSGSIVSR